MIDIAITILFQLHQLLNVRYSKKVDHLNFRGGMMDVPYDLILSI